MRNAYKSKLYPAASASTLKELIDNAARENGNNPAFRVEMKKNDSYIVSYNKFKYDIAAMCKYLIDGNYSGKHIAIFGENRYEWLVAYFAITCSGNVVVPLDNNLNALESKKLLQHSESILLFYSSAYQAEVDEIEINIERIAFDQISVVISKSVIDESMKIWNSCDVSPKDLAAIVYTSGTTGEPKGVMLSHENISSNIVDSKKNVYAWGNSILALPFYHTFGFTCTMASSYNGACLFIPRSMKYFEKSLLSIEPDFLFLVPMIVNAIHKKIWDTAREGGNERKLKSLMVIAKLLLRIGIDVRKRLFPFVPQIFGSKITWIICGGAKVDSKVAEDYRIWGIEVMEGYGLTECSPCIASNRNKSNRIGSAGTIFESCSVKINKTTGKSDGEILVTGKNVMLGYYKDEELTASVFENGWFKTGDLGHFDKDGFLYVTGRLKNLIILSNGENVSPEELEEYLYGISHIKEVIVFAENDLITADIFPDYDVEDYDSIINSEIQRLNKTLPAYKQIKKIKFRQTEFEKTTTRKIKR